MRWLAALVALCGCNQVFGLDTTQLFDAAVRVDAPPDAAPVCPAPGAQFRLAGPLIQAVRQGCGQYTASIPSRLAIAYCYVTDGSTWQYVTSEGRLDDSMGPVKMQAAAPVIDLPRLSPEGDQLYARVYNGSTGYVVEVFDRQADGTWHDSGALPITPSGFSWLTTPTRAPQRHILLAFSTSLLEYADDGAGSWSQVGETTYAELGMSQIAYPSLTGDGLRLTFGGYLMGDSKYRVYVADRTATSGPFANPRQVIDMPEGIFDTYIPEDCSRIYFAALSSIFYAQLTY